MLSFLATLLKTLRHNRSARRSRSGDSQNLQLLGAAAATETLEIRALLSAVATVVEDAIPGGGINSSNLSSSPSQVIDVAGTAYFRATDDINGTELWRINSSGVAEIVEDAVAGGGINPGASSSSPSNLTNVNGTLYFVANDGMNGVELWRINSSGVAGLVEDAIAGGGILPGFSGSNPGNLTNVNGTLYFVANDGTTGDELWRINSLGVAELVEDAIAGGGINPGAGSSSPTNLTNVNGTLYFRANDGTNGVELWRINSSGVAQLVEDAIAGGGINPGASNSNPTGLTNVSGTLYFRANDGVNGTELWRINSSGVAQIVEDGIAGGGIRSGAGSSVPGELTNVNGTLYFRANDGVNGYELWRINSSGVAQIVEDDIVGGGIFPGNNSSNPAYLTNIDGTLYFRANDGVNGYELWRINSSGVAGIVEDSVAGGGVNPGNNHANPRGLTNVSGTLYFSAYDGVNGTELWRINSSGVAEIVEDAIAGGGVNPGASYSNASNLTNVNGTLYFSANDGVNGVELWRINSSGVAEIVEDTLAGGGINPGISDSSPLILTNMNGTLYFSANNVMNGTELWRINSSGVAQMVEDAIVGGGINSGNSHSSPRYLANVNGTLYFSASDDPNGTELWRISSSGVAEIVEDGIAGGGINPGVSSSSPSNLLNVNGTLYFNANDGVNGYELWRINSSGIAQIVEDAIAGGGINPGSSSSFPRELTNVSGTLYFSANDGLNGNELWRISSSGVAEVVEDSIAGGGINSGSSGSYPRYLTNVNGTLYFTASDGLNGTEMWRLNGSGIAEIVEDGIAGGGINPGSSQSLPRELTNVNGTLYFRAYDNLNGYELWRINSSGVAQMVEDGIAGGGVNPGVSHSNPSNLTNVSGTLYFSANDGVNGYELWRISSSGTAEVVEDAIAGGGISFGSSGSYPNYLTNVNGTLYFRANNGTNGVELWRISSSGTAEVVEDAIAGGGIRPGGSSSNPQILTNVNGTLYFRANDGVNGYELWRINSYGVAQLVEDAVAGGGINPGLGDSTPGNLTNVNGTLYFRANDGVNGIELWRVSSSGVAIMIEDGVAGGGVNPGSGNSDPSQMTAIGNSLYFVANDGLANGQELWVVSLNSAPTDISLLSQSLPENAGSNAVVGTLSFTDPDQGDTATFSLPAGIANNPLFNIAPDGITLRANGSFNFEVQNSYSITVRVTDAGGLSFDKQFTISVTDVNEAPTAVTLQNVVSSLPENTSTSSRIRVADILVTDDALGTNGLAVTGPDAEFFEILNQQLFLKADIALNFESKASFNVTVVVDDTTVGSTPDLATQYSLALANVTEFGGVNVQLGQTQRSYLRYLDLVFDRPDDLMSLIDGGRVEITKFNINYSNPTSVSLIPSMFSINGNNIRLDFGPQGLGGNRNSNAGDGYYIVAVNVDGGNTFESFSFADFHRLLGDLTGDGRVDNSDKSQLLSRSGPLAENDVNGDGLLNLSDTSLLTRAFGRKLWWWFFNA